MSSDQKLKKKRDPTFTMDDKHHLVDIIQKYFNIVENKKTDSETMNVKNLCWEKEITEEFNSGALCPRSTTVLKNCWKNLKADGRKVAADERQSRVRTGEKIYFIWLLHSLQILFVISFFHFVGGGPKKEVTVDPIMYRIIDLIRPTAVGLNNPFDADSDSNKGK